MNPNSGSECKLTI